MAKGVFYVIPEYPEVKHVPYDMKDAAVKKHGGEDSHYVVGQQIMPRNDGSDKLPWHETVVGVKRCPCGGMEDYVLPHENNDIYKDQTHCYNGKGACWDIVF
jgi:hypothetical protein